MRAVQGAGVPPQGVYNDVNDQGGTDCNAEIRSIFTKRNLKPDTPEKL